MSVQAIPVTRSWSFRHAEKKRRIEAVRSWMDGPILQADRILDALHLLVQSGDRIVIEGDNQKQADFLSRSLVKADPKKLHDLHLQAGTSSPLRGGNSEEG
jgi:malonate decarboxylase alpha subunit